MEEHTNKDDLSLPTILLSLKSLSQGSASKEVVVRKGINHIFKTADGLVLINHAPTPSQNEYLDPPIVLAAIDARQVTIEKETFLQLELEAVGSFLSVHRACGTAIALSPQQAGRQVYCLGDGDTIRFTSSNASITVSVPSLTDNVQVGSSVPIETHSPKPSASSPLDKVVETPRAQRAQLHLLSPDSNRPFSTAKVVMTQDMAQGALSAGLAQHDEFVQTPHSQPHCSQDAIDAPDFDRDSHISMSDEADPIPPINSRPKPGSNGQGDDPTESEPEDEERDIAKGYGHLSPGVVTQVSRKHSAGEDGSILVPDEDVDGEPVKKRARRRSKKGTPTGSHPSTAASGEVPLSNEAPQKRGRGRPKKATSMDSSTSKPQKSVPSVVIDAETRKTATPSSTANSDKMELDMSPFDTTSIQGTKPSVVFSGSNFPDLPQSVKTFKTFATIQEKVAETTDFLCIGKGGIKTTSKLLLAVARGKTVLTDEWAKRCAKVNHLVDQNLYIAHDTDREKVEDLPSNWSSGQPRTNLLSDYEVFITPALRKEYGGGYSDVRELLSIAGAKKVTSTAVRDVTSGNKRLPENTIIMALPHGDLDALALHEKGYACYDKHFLTRSILRGQLSLDESKIVPVKTPAKHKGRKSIA